MVITEEDKKRMFRSNHLVLPYEYGPGTETERLRVPRFCLDAIRELEKTTSGIYGPAGEQYCIQHSFDDLSQIVDEYDKWLTT